MNSFFGKLFILIASNLILVGSCYVFFDDCVYFLTKREAIGDLISINRVDNNDQYQLKFRYYNSYLKTQTIGTAEIKSQPFSNFQKEKKEHLILYGKNNSTHLYVKDIGSPRVLILLFEMFIIGCMLLAISANRDFYKQKIIPTK